MTDSGLRTEQASPQAPHRATIEIDLWVWERARAWGVLDQLVTALESQATDDQGGVTVHHRFVRADLRRTG